MAMGKEGYACILVVEEADVNTMLKGRRREDEGIACIGPSTLVTTLLPISVQNPPRVRSIGCSLQAMTYQYICRRDWTSKARTRRYRWRDRHGDDFQF